MRILNGSWYKVYQYKALRSSFQKKPKLANLPTDIISDFWELLAFHVRFEDQNLVDNLENLLQTWKHLYELSIDRSMILRFNYEDFQDGLAYRNLYAEDLRGRPPENDWTISYRLFTLSESQGLLFKEVSRGKKYDIPLKHYLGKTLNLQQATFVYINLNVYADGQKIGLQDFFVKQLAGPWLCDLTIRNIWNMDIDKELYAFCTSPKFSRLEDYRKRPLLATTAAKIAYMLRRKQLSNYNQNRRVHVDYENEEAEQFVAVMNLKMSEKIQRETDYMDADFHSRTKKFCQWSRVCFRADGSSFITLGLNKN
ncbi:hypothetical protein L596_010467 [Steinernema carpocapsae]|uniref:Uncharacterized protein n=1 Tax=Steinernema carpocapsae TaxID=34508 RepID=A0A4U5PIG5_STECR|nr:hypothetical protein L596_010467 [Steinernema carpocapsae]